MRTKLQEPNEYVVSRLELKDSNENKAIGFIITPRYDGDQDDKFCGVSGELDIRIEMSSTHESNAYEYAEKRLNDLKSLARLKESKFAR